MVKLTESRLRRIIKEEVASVMKSRGSSRLNEGPDDDYMDDSAARRAESMTMSGDNEPEDEDMLGAYLAVYEHESESVSVEAMSRALKSMGLGNFTPDEVEGMIEMNDNSPLTVNPNTGLVKERGDDSFSPRGDPGLTSMGEPDDRWEKKNLMGDEYGPRYPRR